MANMNLAALSPQEFTTPMLCYVVNQEQPGQVPVQSAGFAQLDPITMQLFLSSLSEGMKWVVSQWTGEGDDENGGDGTTNGRKRGSNGEGESDGESDDEEVERERRNKGGNGNASRVGVKFGGGVQMDGGVLAQRWAGIMDQSAKEGGVRFF